MRRSPVEQTARGRRPHDRSGLVSAPLGPSHRGCARARRRPAGQLDERDPLLAAATGCSWGSVVLWRSGARCARRRRHRRRGVCASRGRGIDAVGGRRRDPRVLAHPVLTRSASIASWLVDARWPSRPPGCASGPPGAGQVVIRSPACPGRVRRSRARCPAACGSPAGTPGRAWRRPPRDRSGWCS